MAHFSKVRHAHDPNTREEQKQSAGRADALLQLGTDENIELQTPLVINPYGEEFTLMQ